MTTTGIPIAGKSWSNLKTKKIPRTTTTKPSPLPPSAAGGSSPAKFTGPIDAR